MEFDLRGSFPARIVDAFLAQAYPELAASPDRRNSLRCALADVLCSHTYSGQGGGNFSHLGLAFSRMFGTDGC